jgi:uncharacterized FlaG/YvyC family protein
MDIPSINSESLPLNIGGPTEVPAADADNRHELIHAVKAINAVEFYGQEHELAFAIDRESRRAVVRIVDRKTRAVVDQIPSEQVLRLAEELKQHS